MSSKDDVLGFLQQMKKAVVENQLSLIPRQKNIEALAEHGLTQNDARDVILDLKPADYVSGPSPDRNGENGDIWVFGAKVGKCDFYIKLKLEWMTLQRSGRQFLKAKCLSFHEAERPLVFPLRE